jgi:hypothetical protein
MKEGNLMYTMTKVVDAENGITIAYLDQEAFERSEDTMARVAAQMGRIYGCDEVTVIFPTGNTRVVRV